jgi:DNA mismatch repair protein MutS
MFRQYREHKRNHPVAILLFRMGDFYEMFHEDAQEASRLLDLTLTARGKGTDNVAPMCGFPHHQLDAYTAKLVRAGRSVAICDQIEDPRTAKGLVKRDVVRVVTPGTLTDPDELDSRENSWIASVAGAGGVLGAAFLDASTGEFLAWQSPAEGDRWDALAERLLSFGPKEIVHPADFPWPEAFRREKTGSAVLTPAEPYPFYPGAAAEILARHFEVATLAGFGLAERPAAAGAAGGLLLYLQETQKSALQHIDRIALHEPRHHLILDPATRRNLEVERSIRDGGRSGSLLHAIDATLTAAGGRLLRHL